MPLQNTIQIPLNNLNGPRGYWPRVFYWYLNDILNSLYRLMVLNGIFNYR